MLHEDHRPAKDAEFMKKDMAKLGWKVDSHTSTDQEVMVVAKPPRDMRWPEHSLKNMWAGEYTLAFLGNGVRFTLKSGYNPHSAVHNPALQGDSKGPSLGTVLAERCSPGRLEEAMVLDFEDKNAPENAWYRIKLSTGYPKGGKDAFDSLSKAKAAMQKEFELDREGKIVFADIISISQSAFKSGFGLTVAGYIRVGKNVKEGLSTRTIMSTNPGLEWRIEKDEEGWRLILVHKASRQVVWTSMEDLVPQEKVASSITALDRVFKDTRINFDTKDLQAVAAPLSAALGLAKKIRRPIDKDVVYFGEATDADLKAVEDRLQAALYKGAVSDED